MQKQEEAWFLATYAPPEDNRLRLFRLLEEHNITAWTPEYQSVQQYPGRRVIRQRALFTGYFFIMLNLNRTPTDFIYQQPGFGGFVRQGNQLLPVPAHLVRQLQRCFPQCLDPEAFASRFPQFARKQYPGLTRSEYNRLIRALRNPDSHHRNSALLSLIFPPEPMPRHALPDL